MVSVFMVTLSLTHPRTVQFLLVCTNLNVNRDGPLKLITIQAGDNLTGILCLIGEPDDPEDTPQAPYLHSRILSLAEGYHIFYPSAYLEVAVR